MSQTIVVPVANAGQQCLTAWCLLQFLQVLTTNIEQISGPVTVTIVPNSITAGSVVVGTQVEILNGDSGSANNYVAALHGNTAAVFGSMYAATVNTVTQTTVTNPNAQTGIESMLTILQTHISIIHDTVCYACHLCHACICNQICFLCIAAMPAWCESII